MAAYVFILSYVYKWTFLVSFERRNSFALLTTLRTAEKGTIIYDLNLAEIKFQTGLDIFCLSRTVWSSWAKKKSCSKNSQERQEACFWRRKECFGLFWLSFRPFSFLFLSIYAYVRQLVRSFVNSTNWSIRWKSLKWLSTYTVVGSLNPRPKPACHLNRIITSLQRTNDGRIRLNLASF